MSGSIPHAIEAHRFSNERSVLSGTPAGQNLSKDSEIEHNPISSRATSDYTVSLSEDAQGLLAKEQQEPESNNVAKPDEQSEPSETLADSDAADSEESDEQGLTEEEQDQVKQLKARDEEVRVHEQAHAATGGQYAGSPSYSYEQGPDGKRYITDGEVPIDISTIPGDPQATIDKMKQVYRAALAPAEPSSADRSIANEAQRNIAEAMSELAQKVAGSGEEDSTKQNAITNRSTLESAYERSGSKHTSGSQIDLVA
ncbi:putative metalloprotease CJM1_0395 family protein [Marinomonas fungiae]|uniref:SprA-related family n=1 Tax=Marinomonas fungiae TaxID=1137284 RepID=A0A0K6IK04_9GAMM|nr:putative metalloprotease CJM1_0395 family protein [Marinomonas fungiae]CUB03438.1 SprA-related family [Marinomonas fungiae]